MGECLKEGILRFFAYFYLFFDFINVGEINA